MTRDERDLGQLAQLSYVRGLTLVLLASVAVRWPDRTLLPALAIGAVVLTALGIFELVTVAGSATPARMKRLLLAQALLSIGFAALGVVAWLASVATMVALSAAWLLAQATLAVAAAGEMPHIRYARGSLLVLAAFDLIAAFVTATYALGTLLPLLYVGTLYVWASGAGQIAVGLWVRRHVHELTALERTAHAM